MNVYVNNRPVIFFRNQSSFCLQVSQEMTKTGLQFFEVITDTSNNQEMPCIISPDYASAFRGAEGVIKFLSLIAKESAQRLEMAYA